MGVVKEVTAKKRYSNLSIRSIDTIEELEKHYDLEQYVAAEMKRLKQLDGRILYLSIGDVMVSACGTSRESRNSAVVIGVVTHQEYRNLGYASEVLIHLARKVYKKLGMTELCQWRVTLVRSLQ